MCANSPPVSQKDPEHFQSIFYRVDPERFKSWQLLYLDTKDLVALNEKMNSHASLIQGFAQRPELLSFLELLNQEMATRMVGELFTGFLDDGEAEVGKKEPFDLGFLIATLEGMSSTLHGSPSFDVPVVHPCSRMLPGNLSSRDTSGRPRSAIFSPLSYPKKCEGNIIGTEEALNQSEEAYSGGTGCFSRGEGRGDRPGGAEQ